MVKRNVGGAAVAEAPKRSAADIAQAVSDEQSRQRQQQIRKDVESWRTNYHSSHTKS